MPSDIQPAPASKTALWTGRIISTLVTMFLLMDAVMKLLKPEFVVRGTVQFGYPQYVIVPLGIVLTTCILLYAIPRTSVLGAILLTGYLGGAVATHVRAGQGPRQFSPAIIVAILVWSGLVLRDSRLRMLLPLRR